MTTLDSNAEKLADSTRKLTKFKSFSLPGVKEKVADILTMIGKVETIFSTYTRHDISHVDAMLKMLDWLVPPSTKEVMSTLDWLMITLAVYLHDLGMIVTTEEYRNRMSNPSFSQFINGLDKSPEGRDYLARTEKMVGEEKERFFYQEFVRMQHASRIKEWITGRHTSTWGDRVKPLALEIAKILEKLPTRFSERLATVCESHHKDNLDKREYFPLLERYGGDPDEPTNIQYAALLLRTADLLHVTEDRTPSVMYKIVQISDPKGVIEWKKQAGTFSVNMKTRVFDPRDTESHVIVVKADFQEEVAFFALTEYLAYADKQIKQTKRWADQSQREADGKNYFFPWHTVKGDILVEGNEPVPIHFDLDKGRLLDLLVGHTIYNDPLVAVRELLQNAIDAVRYQFYLEERRKRTLGEPEPVIGRVQVKWNGLQRELVVEDNGVGMDLLVIKSNLMQVGSSFYDEPQFHTEYPDFSAISKFGIGILTCFMVSDDIEIITCQRGEGYRIRMSSVHGDYLLKQLEQGNPQLVGLEPNGTRVRIRLRSSIDLGKATMLDIVRYWVILPACTVEFLEDDKDPVRIGFDNPREALRYYKLGEKNGEEEVHDVLTFSRDGEFPSKYELGFAVRKAITPEHNFVLMDTTINAPAVCIEGIRAANILPGLELGHSSICALLSVRGDKRFRTTVSRMSLEEDDQYVRVAKTCAELLFRHVQCEVERIKALQGHPLSQASTAGRWIYRTLASSIRRSDVKTLLEALYRTLPQIVVETLETISSETKTRRDLITQDQLEKVGSFWTIESRLVDSLGIISRDLGKELSLNDFLDTLAPELRDTRISPIVSDAHEVSDILLSSHEVGKAEFSRQHQQTLLQWRLRKREEFDVNSCVQFIRETMDNYSKLLQAALPSLFSDHFFTNMDESDAWRVMRDHRHIFLVPIEGDIAGIHGINTRILTVLDPESKAGCQWRILMKAIEKISQTKFTSIESEDFIMIDWGIVLFRLACTHPSRLSYRGRQLHRFDISESWRLAAPRINTVLGKLGINEVVYPDIGDFIVSKENFFDASDYWMKWFSYEQD